MASKPITIGIQSQEGQKRVQVGPLSKTEELYQNIKKAFDLKSVQFDLFKDQRKNICVENSRTKTVKQAGLNHGDRLFMFPKAQSKNTLFENSSSPSSSMNSSSSQTSENGFKVPSSVVEDPIDVEIAKLDGKIPRAKEQKVNCQCGNKVNSQCVHCIPYDPFDEEYLKSQKIKFMSFHSYLRKLSAGVSKGKFTPLRNICCKVVHTSRCSHQPYPAGICSMCQPSAVTLNRQPWRHVDSIVFENPNIVDRFLQFWRESGAQRGGWLYGRYEHAPDVPLGIKAVVAAIYEPKQEGSKDTLKILDDEREEVVEEIAGNLGLQKIGWIFTDLVPAAGGKVKNFRNIDTHFLSAPEIITAGHYQNLRHNPCRQTEEGYFGSKFVTVCVTGNKDQEVSMEGYMVSNQCMALVRDNIIVPTKEAPELAYITESSDTNYVPDVFFMEKDKYGNEIKKVGRPLPVEYLLIDVPVSAPLQPIETFKILAEDRKPFPIENRLLESSIQDFNAFARYISQFRSAEFLDSVSDLHVLVFMATTDVIPLRPYMGPLYEAIRGKNVEAAREWSYLDHWANMRALIQATTMN